MHTDAFFVLEHFLENDGVLHRVPLRRFPFCIGRNGGSDYIIPTREISKRHAEFLLEGDQLRLRDLGSTNGTYVNGVAIKETVVQNGDIIHLGNKEMRVVFGTTVADSSEAQATCARTSEKQHNIFYQDLLQEVLRDREVRVVFQPVVRLRDRSIIGYEALGRVYADTVHINTGELFSVAHLCEMASDLSRLFRGVAFRDAARIPGQFNFFVNVHPEELAEVHFHALLRNHLGQLPKNCTVVLEIHEDTMVDCSALRRFQEQARALGLKVAYDDFGAGQPRLAELAEAPPDYIKLDMKLIRGIDQSPGKQELIKALRRLADQQGIQMIAEGVETVQEAEACCRLGCEFGQGFLLGRPQSLALFLKAADLKTTRPL